MAFSVVWLDHRSNRIDVKMDGSINIYIEINKILGKYNNVGSGRYFIPKDAKLGGL